MTQIAHHLPGFSADHSAWVVIPGRWLFHGADAMAGDWIKMRHDLYDDPAVIALAAETKCVDADHVIGKLHRLWSWADRQTRDGNAPSVTVAWLDSLVGVTGFAEMLIEVGWLKLKGKGFCIPKFDAHISKSAKKRALTSRRVSNHRSVTKPLPEKRRKEKSLPPVAPRVSVGLDLGKGDLPQ